LGGTWSKNGIGKVPYRQKGFKNWRCTHGGPPKHNSTGKNSEEKKKKRKVGKEKTAGEKRRKGKPHWGHPSTKRMASKENPLGAKKLLFQQKMKYRAWVGEGQQKKGETLGTRIQNL